MIPSAAGGRPPGTDMAGPIRYQTLSDVQGRVFGMWTVSAGSVVATNQDGAAMYLDGPGGLVSHTVAPTPGSAVGLMVSASEAVASGASLTVKAKIGGVEKTGTLSVTLTSGLTDGYGFTSNLRSFPVAAGDSLVLVYDANTTAIAQSPAVHAKLMIL